MEARMSPGDKRLYNPSRDVAHNFGEVMKLVAERCSADNWHAIVSLAKDRGVSQEEIGRGCQAMLQFVATQLNGEDRESMSQALSRSGFFDVSETCRVILMAHLGSVMLGMHWAGVREATIGGQGPALTYRNLRWHGKQCAILMAKLSPFRRRWHCFWRRVRLAWRVLCGRHKAYADGRPDKAFP